MGARRYHVGVPSIPHLVTGAGLAVAAAGLLGLAVASQRFLRGRQRSIASLCRNSGLATFLGCALASYPAVRWAWTMLVFAASAESMRTPLWGVALVRAGIALFLPIAGGVSLLGGLSRKPLPASVVAAALYIPGAVFAFFTL